MSTFDPGAAAPPDSGIFGLPHTPDEAKVVVVPVPFAATTSYGTGAERGCEAVFEASKQVDLFDLETGKPYEAGIAMLPISEEVVRWHDEAREQAERVIALGGEVSDHPELQKALTTVNALGAAVNEWTYDTVRAQLEKGKRVALLGGDHSVPYGAIRAHAERYPGLGILHIDAHADLRVAYEGFEWSHASIMHNVASRLGDVARIVQVGVRDFSEEEHTAITSSGGRIRTHFDAEMARGRFNGETWSEQVARIVADLPSHVYVSFDIDGLDPILCPHTGTPVPGGLSFQAAMYLVAAVAKSERTIVGVDLNEVAPGIDGSEWDGNVGARVLYKMIGWMLRSGG